MILLLRKYFLLKILLFSYYLQENTIVVFADSSENDIIENLTCDFEKTSMCNFRLIGAEERYNNEENIEGQYLEFKMSGTKKIFVESPLINVQESGHNFSFYHAYSSSFNRLNVYADDKLIFSYPKKPNWQYAPRWAEAKFELPVGKYKIRIQIPPLYWSSYEYTKLDSFAYDRNRIAEQLDCNFDKNNKCKYYEYSQNDIKPHKWTTQKYSLTGLGYYLYAGPRECKGTGSGFTSLESPCIDVPEKGHFVSFYYYLERSKGLKVEVSFGRSAVYTKTLIGPFVKNTPALNMWHKAKFQLPHFPTEYKMKIRSDCSRPGNGSIAIDSIVVDREPERPLTRPIWN